jgi:ribosomal protein L11 methyltransferase
LIGNWHEEGCSFLFFSRPAAAQIERLLDLQPDLTLIDKYHMSYEHWLGERPQPFHAGRFLISPAWQAPAQKREWDIVLDPGVVFGTGTHPTTHRCLEAIEWVFGQGAVHTALDCGTGTGLLALAIAKLGCRRVLAVDLNPLCTQTAARNAKANGLAGCIAVVQGRAEELAHCTADLLVANIHFDVMRRLVATEGFCRKPWFVLSGLLPSQYRRVRDQLAAQGAAILKIWDCDGVWFTLCGKNDSHLKTKG